MRRINPSCTAGMAPSTSKSGKIGVIRAGLRSLHDGYTAEALLQLHVRMVAVLQGRKTSVVRLGQEEAKKEQKRKKKWPPQSVTSVVETWNAWIF